MWKKYTGYDQQDQGLVGQSAHVPGPLYTSDLFGGKPLEVTVILWLYGLLIVLDIENEKLKDHLMEELDYSVIPEADWEKLVEWYGMAPGSRPIARKVVEYGLYMKYIKVEVYRLEFKLTVHPKLSESIIQEFSRADTVGKCMLSLHCTLCSDAKYMHLQYVFQNTQTV